MISIIVPLFNMEKYMINSLEALVNQSTEKKYEIILINDGSTDNTLDICNEYVKRYDNIRLFNIKNSGVSAARNLGIINAKGSHIMFCDGDDIYESNTIENIYQTIDENDPDLIIFNRKDISDGKVIAEYSTHNSVKLILDNKTYMEQFFSNGVHSFLVCNKVYKRIILEKNKIFFNEELKLSEDTLFNLEYIKSSKSFCEDFRSTYFRNYIIGSTIYKSIDNFFEKNIKFIDYFIKDLSEEEKKTYDLSINKLYYFYGKISIFRSYMNIDGANLKERTNNIKRVLNDERFIKSLKYKDDNYTGIKERLLNSLYKRKMDFSIYFIYGFLAKEWRALKNKSKD